VRKKKKLPWKERASEGIKTHKEKIGDEATAKSRSGIKLTADRAEDLPQSVGPSIKAIKTRNHEP